jgi:dienelactone hydrolase
MTEVVLIHHVQGLTDGVLAFADGLREGGHVVHTPDIFDGQRLATIEDGLRLTQELGDAEIGDRLTRQIVDLPADVVWAGISYGVSMAQLLAQTQPGARGALLYAACFPVTGEWAFGPWPKGVPVQIHGKDRDPFFAEEGDIDAARQLVDTIGPELGQLFVYPGEEHLYMDSSLPSYDPEATALTLQRSRELLDRVR